MSPSQPKTKEKLPRNLQGSSPPWSPQLFLSLSSGGPEKEPPHASPGSPSWKLQSILFAFSVSVPWSLRQLGTVREKGHQSLKMHLSSTNEWGKQNVVHPHSGILLSHKKGCSTVTHHDVGEPENMMPRERSRVQNATYYTAPSIQNVQNRQIHRVRK